MKVKRTGKTETFSENSVDKEKHPILVPGLFRPTGVVHRGLPDARTTCESVPQGRRDGTRAYLLSVCFIL